MLEVFVQASILELKTIDPGEICIVRLALPKVFEMEGISYPIQDEMRPGTAFLAKPFGTRTQKFRRKMYTRSNCSVNQPGILETVINHTHQEKADSSIWWQTPEAEVFQALGRKMDILVGIDPDRSEGWIFENASHCDDHNLRLEPDGEWENKRYLAMAFSTGITPFLSYLRYMKALNFGKTNEIPGSHLTLVASARTYEQLIEHEELLQLEKDFPNHFQYHPVLTRKWPDQWRYTKGRIIRTHGPDDGQVDLGPLLEVVPDLSQYHIRMCGGRIACFHLEQGLKQRGHEPLSYRAEVW